jgi:arylsulfatase A-like enzyme
MIRLAGFCLLAALVACAPGGPAASSKKPPHVLLLVMDTTRGDRCSVNGHERETTPRLEALAREGVNFRNAWSPAGWTAPAHASLFTGVKPERHGCLIDNNGNLDDRFETLAESLREVGYRAGCFTQNPYISEKFGLSRGFEVAEQVWKRTDLDRPYARACHKLALEWALAAHRGGERFFLFVNDMEPHLPYAPGKRFQEKFVPRHKSRARVRDARGFTARNAMSYMLGQLEVTDEKLGLLRALYDAEIAELDDEVGSLVEGLRKAGILDETLVVVTSDHGENIGDRGMASHMSSLNRSIRHVPLVARLPGTFEGGEVVDDVVRLEDLHPTILELCGAEAPHDLDAESLLRDVPGRVSLAYHGKPNRNLLMTIQTRNHRADLALISPSIRAVFDGRHHLIVYSDGREELYDVTADPAEERNLAGEGGAVLDRLRGLLGQ